MGGHWLQTKWQGCCQRHGAFWWTYIIQYFQARPKSKTKTVCLEGQLWKKPIHPGYWALSVVWLHVLTGFHHGPFKVQTPHLGHHHKILPIAFQVNWNYSYQIGPLTFSMCPQLQYKCSLKLLSRQISDLPSSAVYTFLFSYLNWKHLQLRGPYFLRGMI